MRAPDQNAAPPRSLLARLLIGSWEYRYPYAFGLMRLAAGLWLFILGSILCGVGYWWGALLIVAAALILSTGYYVLRHVQSQRAA